MMRPRANAASSPDFHRPGKKIAECRPMNKSAAQRFKTFKSHPGSSPGRLSFFRRVAGRIKEVGTIEHLEQLEAKLSVGPEGESKLFDALQRRSVV
jgi:hypothetical protein